MFLPKKPSQLSPFTFTQPPQINAKETLNVILSLIEIGDLDESKLKVSVVIQDKDQFEILQQHMLSLIEHAKSQIQIRQQNDCNPSYPPKIEMFHQQGVQQQKQAQSQQQKTSTLAEPQDYLENFFQNQSQQKQQQQQILQQPQQQQQLQQQQQQQPSNFLNLNQMNKNPLHQENPFKQDLFSQQNANKLPSFPKQKDQFKPQEQFNQFQLQQQQLKQQDNMNLRNDMLSQQQLKQQSNVIPSLQNQGNAICKPQNNQSPSNLNSNNNNNTQNTINNMEYISPLRQLQIQQSQQKQQQQPLPQQQQQQYSYQQQQQQGQQYQQQQSQQQQSQQQQYYENEQQQSQKEEGQMIQITDSFSQMITHTQNLIQNDNDSLVANEENELYSQNDFTSSILSSQLKINKDSVINEKKNEDESVMAYRVVSYQTYQFSLDQIITNLIYKDTELQKLFKNDVIYFMIMKELIISFQRESISYPILIPKETQFNLEFQTNRIFPNQINFYCTSLSIENIRGITSHQSFQEKLAQDEKIFVFTLQSKKDLIWFSLSQSEEEIKKKVEKTLFIFSFRRVFLTYNFKNKGLSCINLSSEEIKHLNDLLLFRKQCVDLQIQQLKNEYPFIKISQQKLIVSEKYSQDYMFHYSFQYKNKFKHELDSYIEQLVEENNKYIQFRVIIKDRQIVRQQNCMQQENRVSFRCKIQELETNVLSIQSQIQSIEFLAKKDELLSKLNQQFAEFLNRCGYKEESGLFVAKTQSEIQGLLSYIKYWVNSQNK